MKVFIAILFLLVLFELRGIKKAKLRKEKFVLFAIAFSALNIGVIYLSNPYRKSLAEYFIYWFGE